jgi:DnaJ-class molecular chaperone
MSESFYNTLNVPETASQEDIKKAYRKMSMTHHPDKNNNSQESTEKFQKISEAYEVLGDIDKKREYDMMQNNPFLKMMGGGGGGHPMNHMAHMNPMAHMGQMNPIDELFSNLFGMPFVHMGVNQMPGQQQQQGHPQQQQGFPFGPNVRVFHNGVQVNQGQNGGVPFGQKPTPIVKNVTVPIDKILTGTTIPVDIERWIMENGNKVFENETVYVTVPKGIDEGEIIVLNDKGNIMGDNCKGDIKVFIKIENNTEFKRSGLDLVLEKTITVKDALCGFSFELKYITGKVYTITNNSGNIISHGYKKLIPGMGFERDGHRGNLIIVFDVKFPEKLTPESIEALKAIDF